MSKKTTFDINKIVCPLCQKTHSVERMEFDRYYFKCYVFEKEFNIAIANTLIDHKKIWAKWIKYEIRNE